MPSQRFQASADAPVVPAEAWDGLQRPEVWERIAGVDRVTEPVHDADGRLSRFRVHATVAGRSHPGHAVVTSAVPPGEMRVELTTVDLAATIDVTLSPTDAGTRVSVVIDVHARSFLAGLFFPAVAEAIGSGLDSTVDDFARNL